MCLYSKNRFPRIAWKPIKVYKIVGINVLDNYITPYRGYELKHRNLVNIFNTLLSIIFNVKKSRNHTKLDLYEINYGFFHSFYDRERASKNFCSIVLYTWIKDFDLIEATIPRFSLYYKGVEGDICSNRLNTEFKKI